MKATYMTKDDDMLDQIAFNFYGFSKGAVEKILEENRHLAFQPIILPARIEIVLPEIEQPASTEGQKLSLWD